MFLRRFVISNFICAFLVLLLSLPLSPVKSVNAAPISSSAPKWVPFERPIQFTSGDHTLGFDSMGVTIAAGSQIYRESFVGTAGTAPLADLTPNDDEYAPPFEKVTYSNLWEGINLVYDSPQGSILRSTFEIDPGADPGQIALSYNIPVELDGSGNLVFVFTNSTLTASAPIAWQVINNQVIPVDVTFQIHDPSSAVSFALGSYNPAHPLTIDPTLTWNTFLGWYGDDQIEDITVDGSGNIYVTGYSDASWGSPISRHSIGNDDVFVAKLDSSGNLIWNTFLGAEGSDHGNAITLDDNGNILITGESSMTWGSPRYPHRGSDDAFVVKLDTNGNLVWNTFLGDAYSDSGSDIALDANGQIYITGSNYKYIPNFGSSYSNTRLFIARVDSYGFMSWLRYFGSSDNYHDTIAEGITVDAAGNIFLAGYADSSWHWPVSPHTGSDDAFVARLDNYGSLVWNTFLGSDSPDRSFGITIDGSGDVVVAGRSERSWGSPINLYTPWENDAFVAKLDSNSGSLVWNTFLGSNSDDRGYAITVDSSDNIYLAGYSESTWGSPENNHSGIGSDDAFAAMLDSNGGFVWNTFLGGVGDDHPWSIEVDSRGAIYLAGWSSASWGSPVNIYRNNMDGFVALLGNPFMDIRGNGNAISNGSATPDPSDLTDFGEVHLDGGTAVHTFQIENPGTAELTIHGAPLVNITGANAADFQILTTPHSSLNPGESTNLEIQFDPSSVGLRTAAISIGNNVPGEDPFEFAIQGTGIAPEIDLFGNNTAIPNGSSLPSTNEGTDFGSVPISGTASKTFTIQNNGTADLVLNGITFSGPNETDFSVVTPPNSPVAAGEETSFTVEFNPPADGLRQATINITSTDSDENPYTFALQGNGYVIPIVLLGANTFPSPNANLAVGLTHLRLEFNMDVKGSGDSQSANAISNYLLFSDGGDGVFDTVNCASGVSPNDINVPIYFASYDDNDDAGPYIVTLMVNNDIPLPRGSYRLLACGTTSIESLAGTELNDGSDSALDFSVQGSSTATAGPSLPKTGYSPGEVLTLPDQPATARYQETTMMLSIPKLDLEALIVGVSRIPNGWDVTWLGSNVGYLAGSSYPTWVGNTVLTGHVWDTNNSPGPFATIKTLRYGDEVQIFAGGQTYTYEVRTNKLISPENVDAAFTHKEYDWITLITCESYNDFGGIYDHRRMVQAVLVKIQ